MKINLISKEILNYRKTFQLAESGIKRYVDFNSVEGLVTEFGDKTAKGVEWISRCAGTNDEFVKITKPHYINGQFYNVHQATSVRLFKDGSKDTKIVRINNDTGVGTIIEVSKSPTRKLDYSVIENSGVSSLSLEQALERFKLLDKRGLKNMDFVL